MNVSATVESTFTPPAPGTHCDYWVAKPIAGSPNQTSYECMTTAQYQTAYPSTPSPSPSPIPRPAAPIESLTLWTAIFGSILIAAFITYLVKK